MAVEPRPPEEPARPDVAPGPAEGEASRDLDTAGHAGPASALTRLLEELARTPDPGALVEVSQRRIDPGERVGRFELLREVGRGGFGVVFEARDTDLDRLVAFKAFRPGRPLDARQVEALRREAVAAAQLNHPSVVTVHDFGNCPAGPYVIMELLRGEPLSQRVERGPLPPREAVRIGLAVAQALVHAHAAGVIHRDLKPGNVFLCTDGKVKVLDFGLARLLGAGGERGGTPGYMAPEQCRGEAEDERTDLFGLGVLLFRMLTGRLPYEVVRGRSAVLDPGPTPSPQGRGLPPRLAALVQRLLQRNPAARAGNALEVQDELAALDRAVDPLQAARRRRARLALAAAVVLAAGGGALAGLWSRHLRARSQERVTVAVADFENATGDPQLDGLSGLLITSLEQSRKLQVLTRARMRDELRKLGREEPERLDESAARAVGKAAGARALLLASMRQLGSSYAVELRALDPRSNEYLFTASDRAGSKEEVPAVLDRLSERTRRELHERAEEVRQDRVEMGPAVTRNLEAYQHYFRGLECMERPRELWEWDRCAPHFRAAVAADPGFALAHYQLARVASTVQTSGAITADRTFVRGELAAALQAGDRLPAKERALVRALEAVLEGDFDAAVARYREVLARYPDDKLVNELAGSLLADRGDSAGAIPFLARAAALDPSFERAVRGLVHALGKLQRRDELASQLVAWGKLPQNPALRGARVRAAVWMGALDEALAAARENLGASSDPALLLDLAIVQFQRGEFLDVEATVRRGLAAAPDHVRLHLRLATALHAQGRHREAFAMAPADRSAAGDARPWVLHTERARYLAGSAPAADLLREVLAAAATDREMAALHAADLAVLGDLKRATELVGSLRLRTPDREVAEGAISWRSGDVAGARARLRALDAVEPVPDNSLPPAFVLAELAAAEGDDAAVVDAAARFRSSWSHLDPRGGWMAPRVALLEARALARLGRKEAARGRLEALLAHRARADPGDALLAEASSLRAQLAGPADGGR